LLSVCGPLALEDLAPASFLASGKTDALAEVSSSVTLGADKGSISVHLQPGAVSFDTAQNGEVRLSSSGLDTVGDVGAPELPSKLLRIALPIDASVDNVTLTVDSSKVKKVSGSYHLTAGAVPVTDSALGTVYDTGGIQLVDGKNPSVYQVNAYYGQQFCTLLDVQQMGRWKIAEVLYSPFEYNPAKGTVRVVSDVKFTLNYQKNSPLSSVLASQTTWDTEAANMLLNYKDAGLGYAAAAAAGTATATAASAAAAIPGVTAAAATTANYVIITTSAIQNNSQMANFVAHKQSMGYSVAVITEGTWGGGTGNTASERIRTWLKNNYASMGIQYVLMVGNPDPSAGDVPMKMTWPRNSQSTDKESPTDYYYSDLTSNWNSDGDSKYGEWGLLQDFYTMVPIHEVYVGRIPVYNADYAALNGIFAKTIGYETETDISWRKNMLLPMAVSNYANEDGGGKSRTDGANLGERIKSDLATPNSFGTYTMYEQAGLSPVTTPCNAPISKTNVLTTWATNPYGIVDWWGHGNQEAAYRKYWAADDGDGVPEGGEMTWEDFINSGDTALLNNARPSIVTQISCQNSWPENSNNLAYALLKNGAIGTYAGTRNTFYQYGNWTPSTYGDNASYAYYITQRLVQNQTTESLGMALQWCRENLSPTVMGSASWFMNRTDFNLYGDPAVKPFKAATGASISGNVWNDANANAAKDAGEANLSGWTVFLDENNNGILDNGTTTVSSGTINLVIPDPGTTTTTITASGIGGTISDVDVMVNINHTWDNDMNVFLIAPDGTRVELFTNVGGGDDNFSYTVLDDEAGAAITAGAAPFAGRYRPEGLLSAFDGRNANGVWTLEISDSEGQDVGTLVNWSIDIRTTGATKASSGIINLPMADPGDTYSSLAVSGLGGKITDVNVTININHTWDGDVTGYLVAPDGTWVTLFVNVGGGGWNFTETTFDDEAPTSIAAGAAPFTGSFKPQGFLSKLDAHAPNGTWTLVLNDNLAPDAGTLVSWSLAIDTAEKSTLTDASGNYAFSALPAGNYTVREVPLSGWSLTTPTSGYHSVTLATGGSATGRNFGNRVVTGLMAAAPPSLIVSSQLTAAAAKVGDWSGVKSPVARFDTASAGDTANAKRIDSASPAKQREAAYAALLSTIVDEAEIPLDRKGISQLLRPLAGKSVAAIDKVFATL
jgi:subtilisin-like proprotein convertase family protein